MVTTKTPAIDKAAKIFQYIAEKGESSYSEIYQNIGLAQSSASALLASLVAHGFLRQDKGKYYLGFVFYELGNKAIDHIDIRDFAREPLNRLSELTGLSAHLGILSGNYAIYLAKSESKEAIAVRSWVGKRLSLHSSSLGKVLLAWLTEEKIDQLLPQETLPKTTQHTITSKKAFKQALLTVRQQGWAFDHGEDCDDVNCIAAPIYNQQQQVIAAISISGVAFQLSDDKIPAYVEHVLHAARQISNRYMGRNE